MPELTHVRFSVLALAPLLLASAALAQPAKTPAGPSTGPLPGQIIIDPAHPQWLKRHGGKHVFICGPGDPEDFLYAGKRLADGTRDGDQVARIKKLAEHGGNSASGWLREHHEQSRECPYGYMTRVNTDGDLFPGSDRAWAQGSGAGGMAVLWNHKNGIVFAGLGVDTRRGAGGVPHDIESCIAGPSPLATK